MLTDISYKDVLLIKRRTCDMFGHGFITVNSHVVVNVDKASVESSKNSFNPFSFDKANT